MSQAAAILILLAVGNLIWLQFSPRWEPTRIDVPAQMIIVALLLKLLEQFV